MSEFAVNPESLGGGQAGKSPAETGQISDADQMNALLGAISKMMAEAENRQSAALNEMQERISRLAANTRGTKERLPGEFQGAFQQIEDAMEQLASKVHNSTAAVNSIDDSTAADNEKKLASLAHHFVFPGDPTQGDADVTTSNITAVENSYAAPIQVAQPVQYVDVAGNPDGPWDEMAAEKLTQLYESGEAGLPTIVEKLPDAPYVPIPNSPGQTVIPAQTVASMPAVDMEEQRAWFEDNFNQVLTQIEATAAIASENEVDHIDLLKQQLEEMEGRLQSTMDELPKGADLAALRDIEACIVEFTSQLESTQSDLERITQVEALVQELTERLSEERLVQFEKQPDIQQPNIDSEQIAELVAQHVSEVATGKLISALPEPASIDTEALSEVKGLVNNLIAEHRYGGKQTTERLDVLQQATLQLLERLEKVETTQENIAKDMASLPLAPAQAPVSQVQPEVPAQTPNMQLERPNLSREPVNATYRPNSAATIGSLDPEVDELLEADESNEEQEAATERPNRNNFVAEARKAAARANQRAASELNAGNVRESVLEEKKETNDGKADAQKTARTSRTRLAIAAIALAVIGIGAGNFLFKMTATPPTGDSNPPAKIESNQSPSSTTGSAVSPTRQQPLQNQVPAVKKAVATNQDGVPIGVALEKASDSFPTAAIARQQRQQELAALSTRTGATQPTAEAVPTSLIPVEPQASQTITGRSSQLSKDMPSALVGPLSLRLAAASGDLSATFEVGARYAEGKGIRQNFKEAARWYTKSATRGFALAQYRLATLYERGLGVDKDLSRAKIWYERAARQGNVKSMHNLAVITAGSGTGQSDYGQAARWFTEAANRGLADSQFNLAILYQNGLGVTKDLKQAYHWFGLAARAGDKDADARRKNLISEMKPSDVARADSTIQQWRRKGISRLANYAYYAGLQWKKRTQNKNQ